MSDLPQSAADLQQVALKRNLIVVVSDPDIPPGPDKESKRIDVGQLMDIAGRPIWDVTPQVTSTAVVPGVVDQQNTMFDLNTGTLSFTSNALSAPHTLYSSVIGCAKSNITVGNIPEGETCQFGFTANGGFGSSGVTYMGVIIAPGRLSAANVAAAFQSMLESNGTPYPNDAFIVGMSGTFMGNEGNSMFAHIPTVHTTTPPTSEVTESAVHPAPNTMGKKADLIVRKNNGRISVTYVGESADGTGHQIFPVYSQGDVSIEVYSQGDVSIEDPAVFPDTLTVFYVILTMDVGTGYQQVSLTPSADRRLSSNTVAGTLFETEDAFGNNVAATDTDWDTAFPRPFVNLVNTTVTQATLPSLVTAGMEMIAAVDPDYTAPYPIAPYGVTVKNGQEVLVQDGDTPIRTIHDNETLPDALAPLAASITALESNTALQLQTMADTIADYGTQIQTLQQGLQGVGKNVDEYVIYVSNPSSTNTAGMGNAAFSTFDEAYEAALLQPPILRKRIVFDDRDIPYGSTIGRGAPGKVYHLLANNIILSTHRAMRGMLDKGAQNPSSGGSGVLIFQAAVDGLYVENFTATLTELDSDQAIDGRISVIVLSSGPTDSTGYPTDTNFRIGDNCAIWIPTTATFDLAYGGVIAMGDNSYFSLITQGHSTNDSVVLTITKGNNSYLDVVGSLWEDGFSWPTRPMRVYTPRDTGRVQRSGLMLFQCAVFFTGPRTSELVNGAVVVRNTSDFVDSSGYISPGTYFIVGEIDLTGTGAFYPYGAAYSLVLLGTTGSKLIVPGGFYLSGGSPTVIIRNVDIESPDVGPAVLRSQYGANIDIKDSSLIGNAPIEVLGVGGSVTLRDVKILGRNSGYANTSLRLFGVDKLTIEGLRAKMSNVSLLQMGIGANSSVLLDGIDAYYETNNFPSLFDIGSLWGSSTPVSNAITLRDYRVMVETGPRWFELFTSGGSPVDHTTTPFISLENSSPFVDMLGNGVLTLNGPGDSVNVNIPTVATASKFETSLVSAAYVGQEPEHFYIEIDATIQASLARIVQFSLFAGDASPQLIGNFVINFDQAGVDKKLSIAKRIRLKGNDGTIVYAAQLNGSAGETNVLVISEWKCLIRRM